MIIKRRLASLLLVGFIATIPVIGCSHNADGDVMVAVSAANAAGNCPSFCANAVQQTQDKANGGNCVVVAAQPCFPFGCDPTGTHCALSCATNADCAALAVCDPASHQCSVPSAPQCPQCPQCPEASPSQTLCASTCQDGFEQLRADNGTGCEAIASLSCYPYTCAGTSCATTCGSNADCAPGIPCDTNGHCATGIFRCSADGLSAVDPSGAITSCENYRCRAGRCLERCTSVNDCSPPTVCDGTNTCIFVSGVSAR